MLIDSNDIKNCSDISSPICLYQCREMLCSSCALNGTTQAIGNCGELDLLQLFTGNNLANISKLILSMNVGLGFPLCFYNVMTELWKSGLTVYYLYSIC